MDANNNEKSPSISVPTIALNDEPVEDPDTICAETQSPARKHPPSLKNGSINDSTLSPYSAVMPYLSTQREIVFPDNISTGSFAALRYTPRSQLRNALSSFIGMNLPDMDRISVSDGQISTVSVNEYRSRSCCKRCAGAPWAWICWVSLMSFVFVLNPFGTLMMIIEACNVKSTGRRKNVCRILQLVVGILGILAVIAVVCYWKLSADPSTYSVAGMQFQYRSGSCNVATCCSTDKIYSDSYCYWSPDASSLSSCRYIIQWTCNTDRYAFTDLCDSDRCCQLFETYYAGYCYRNASVAASPPSTTTECLLNVNGTCYRSRYFTYSSNGCPSSALYSSDSYCYF